MVPNTWTLMDLRVQLRDLLEDRNASATEMAMERQLNDLKQRRGSNRYVSLLNRTATALTSRPQENKVSRKRDK